MEIQHNLNPKYIFALIYVLCFGAFLKIGFLPAEAANYDISAELSIPSINLDTDVTTLQLKDHQLDTPDYIVGSFSRANHKTLLLGHSSTVFKSLANVNVGDLITYDNTDYLVTNIELLEKADINMNSLLSAAEKDTLVLMTCAGESLPNKDATHRLIITAVSE